MVTKITNLSELAKLDGGLPDAQFRAELKRVLEDIHDRPNLKAPREITIKLKVKPTADSTGAMVDVRSEIAISCSIPKVTTREYSMGCSGTEGLVYSDGSPENHNQRTLDEAKE